MKHSSEFVELVEGVSKNVSEIAASSVQERLTNGAKLIDVREDHEWNEGHAKQASHLGRGIIERDIVKTFPNKDQELILYCGGGYRSILSADSLHKMGYRNVFSVVGGWKELKEVE